MRAYVITFFVALVLGLAGGVALGVFVYPVRLPRRHRRHREGRRRPAGSRSARCSRAARFIHANPSDPIHYGKGRVTVYEGLLHLEPDFEVGPGPKFHVYLVPEKEVVPSTNVARTMFVDLGRLKAFKGSQNYEVPAGVDVAKFGIAW